jgi:hypothetical protein
VSTCSVSPLSGLITTHLCPVLRPSSVQPSPETFITIATVKCAPASMSSTLGSEAVGHDGSARRCGRWHQLEPVQADASSDTDRNPMQDEANQD